MKNIPNPHPEDLKKSEQLKEIIKEKIKQNNGYISFKNYMNLVLYFPQLGYYSGNQIKFGKEGDFITAPNISPLFAQTLCIQFQEIIQNTEKNIFEFGAGKGELAADILNHIGDFIEQYYIIDISTDLKERQKEYIQQHAPKHFHKVIHLSELPNSINGIILGNEILDALPVDLIEWDQKTLYEIGVTLKNDEFQFIRVTSKHKDIHKEANKYQPETEETYKSELHLLQIAFIRTIAQKLNKGAAIFIDYGFDCHEYYHPQRKMGTLIGHFQHHTVEDPFIYPGLIDLTAHVNFTAIAEVAIENNLDLIGYTTQSHFLINLGILTLLEQLDHHQSILYIKEAQAIKKLLNPHEMGEFFKVMALGKNIPVDWSGFHSGDLCHKL